MRADQERARTLITLPPETLARYAGRYVLGLEASMTVTFEDGRLFGQVTVQRWFELFAESETEFFITIVAAQASFVTGEDGRVELAILHQVGRDIPMMRAGPEGGGNEDGQGTGRSLAAGTGLVMTGPPDGADRL
jgi:D-alanyl-D-alanine-carboxypeptidase/D-alanyl-D-alanine-endopeptidase